MTRRDFFLLFLLGLLVNLAIAQFQSLPGYMDADYYFGGGIQLVNGNGFTEPYLWNYLADPQTLPAPSHAYWLPLASLLAAAGMWLTGQTTYAAARIGFILLAALVPPMTATLAFRLTSNRIPSLLSGLLACFSIYYAPFLPVTDNYAIYMLLGISFFLLLSSLTEATAADKLQITNYRSLITFLLLGLISALASLARSEGLLWLGLSFLVAIWYGSKQAHNPQYALRNTFFVALAFLLLASPWYARNLSTFGTLMAPGGVRPFWLTSYNDTFTFPASQLTMQSWLASGWDTILEARLSALLSPTSGNLLNAFAAQGGIFLFPFILIGLWQLRHDTRIRFAVLAWGALLFAMTVVFPFAGPRGAFFHSGAALQPMWWSLAPIGLDSLIKFARGKGLFDDRAFVIFRGALVGLVILMTGVIFVQRVLPGWEREDGHYAALETLLVQKGAPMDAVVIVRNPPGYNVVTGRPAIAIPAGGIPAIFAVANQFEADYLILEPDGTSPELRELYDNPYMSPAFVYLGESNGNRLYGILR